MTDIQRAIEVMHLRYGIPHIVITSVSLPHPDHPLSSLSVVGSTMTSARRPRAFKIVFPAIDCYFSGTGDMFAALMVVRMREAVCNHDGGNSSNGNGNSNGDGQAAGGLMDRAAWLSGDEVDALDLPLARAAEKVLASMHEVLAKTAERMEGAVEKARRGVAAGVVADGVGSVDGAEAGAGAEAEKKKTHFLKSNAAELRLVRHLDSLRFPKVEFRATRL
jgi:pyridoxine kinase